MTLDSPGLRNRRHGNDGDRETAALFLTAALVNLLPYLLLAPWADENSTSFHWPLLGYLPLLPFAPLALRHLYRLWLQRWGRAVAIRLAAGVPAIGFGGTLLALAVVGSQAFHHPLQDLFGTDVLSNKMAGWRAFTTHTRHLMQARFPAAPPVIITDNYYTAAQLEFAGFEPPIYTLDQNKAVRDGRAQQLHIWQRDEAALDRLTGRAALLITEDSTLRVLPREDVVRRACSRASRIDLISRLSLYRGDKIFSYYVIPRLTPRQPDLSRGSAPQSPPAIRCSR